MGRFLNYFFYLFISLGDQKLFHKYICFSTTGKILESGYRTRMSLVWLPGTEVNDAMGI